MVKLLGAGITKFQKLREMVDKAVEHALEQGEPGKSYEGAWEVNFCYPSTDCGGASKDADYCQIVLHCYLLGPSRHYSWRGNTFAEAVDKCEKDVVMWCAEEMENG